MKGIKEIKRRIKAVKSTAQITRAMQLVAVSKMKRAQDAAKHSRPYSLLLAEILKALGKNVEGVNHPFFEPREAKTRGILVISTDKGLCGGLNSNLFRVISTIEGPAKFVSIGRKASQFIARSGYDLMAEFSVSDKSNFSEVRPAVEFMIKGFLEGKIDTLEVLFPRFINTLSQVPSLERLLPIVNFQEEIEALFERLKDYEHKIPEDDREFQFEPSESAIVSRIPELFIKQEIFQMVLESKASEHSARMVAMKSATDNAKELVRKLSLEYNKARQAAITQEILEIAAATAQSSEAI